MSLKLAADSMQTPMHSRCVLPAEHGGWGGVMEEWAYVIKTTSTGSDMATDLSDPVLVVVVITNAHSSMACPASML